MSESSINSPYKQPKRGRLWLTDMSCFRPRPCWGNHLWAYDFSQARPHNGTAFPMLTANDDLSRECPAIEVSRRLRSDDVLACLAVLFAEHRRSDNNQSDNGSEFTPKAVRD